MLILIIYTYTYVFLDLGIHIEQGMFISQISPTSPLAKDGTLCMGDRIITVSAQYPIRPQNPNSMKFENIAIYLHKFYY